MTADRKVLREFWQVKFKSGRVQVYDREVLYDEEFFGPDGVHLPWEIIHVIEKSAYDALQNKCDELIADKLEYQADCAHIHKCDAETIEDLRMDHTLMSKTLQSIADEDFRGNRPMASVKAYEALQLRRIK